MLGDDVKEEESTHDNKKKTKELREGDFAEPFLEMDNQDVCAYFNQ